MLADTATANINGYGLTSILTAALIAIGVKSTAVAVLLRNIVTRDVAKYTMASSPLGPTSPNPSSRKPEMAAVIPVLSKATDIGIIDAISTTLLQFILEYASSMLRRHPVTTISTAATSTAATEGIMSSTITMTIASIIMAASGALLSRVTLASLLPGCPTRTKSSVKSSRADMFFHVPCIRRASPECSLTSFMSSLMLYSPDLLIPKTFTP